MTFNVRRISSLDILGGTPVNIFKYYAQGKFLEIKVINLLGYK